jgi:hypothetical protein
MPYKFTFKENNHQRFECQLLKLQCTHINPTTNQRCKRFQIIGCGLCWAHLQSDRHLKVKSSTIPNAGRGLFAYNKTDNRDIVFRKGDFIINYDGEKLNELQLNTRYGNSTAPYSIKVKNNYFEDGACRRSPGSLINHQPNARVNSRYSTNYRLIKIFATKNIRNGDEIFINYQDKYLFNEEGVEHKTKFIRSNL